MDQIPAAMDRHLEVIRYQKQPDKNGIILGASSLTGRYWFGSLWYYDKVESAPDVEQCQAGVQLEAGLSDARWFNDTKVLLALDTGGVALWELVDDYRNFVLLHTSVEHDNMVNCVSISADQNKAVSCSDDCRIKVWDLSNLTSTYCYKAHSDFVVSSEFHPSNSDMFISASKDGKLLLWDTRKVKPASILDDKSGSGLPTCVSWQKDNDNIYCIGDEIGQLIIKDIRMASKTCHMIKAHTRSICRIEYSNSKPNLLASVGNDCRTVVVSIQDECIKPLYSETKHTDFVHGLCWLNETVITCGWDSQVYRHCLNGENEKQKTNECVMEVTKEMNNKLDVIVDNKENNDTVISTNKDEQVK